MKTLNHKIFNQRNLFFLIGALFICWLLWKVFGPGVHSPSHKKEQKQVEQVQKDLRAADKIYAIDSARWKKRGDSLELELATAHEQLDLYKKELKAGAQKAKSISGAIQKAKEDRDTAAIVQACDSLQYLVDQQAGVITHYEVQTDSMFLMYGQALAAKDSMINSQTELLSRMRSANLNLETQYTSISTDYNRVVRKAKQGRTTNRILAAAAVVLGGIIISK